MIETLRCTSFHHQDFSVPVNGDDLEHVVRRTIQVIAGEATVDVSYQLDSLRDGVVARRLDLTYRVTFCELPAVSLEEARQATWPYVRMAVLHHCQMDAESLSEALPIADPLTATEPQEGAVGDDSAWDLPTPLPAALRTDLLMMAALGRIARREEPWLRSATHLYLALSVLTDKNGGKKQLGDRLHQILEREIGCTVEDLKALPPSTLRRYRDHAKLLFVTAVHAVFRLGWDKTTGTARDLFSEQIQALFSSLEGLDVVQDGPPRGANRLSKRDIEEAIFSHVFAKIAPFGYKDRFYEVIRDDLGFTIVAYGCAYDCMPLSNPDNLGSTDHVIGIYLLELPSAISGSRRRVVQFIRDLSAEFDERMMEHDDLVRSEDEIKRRRHIDWLNSRPLPIPKTPFATVEHWPGLILIGNGDLAVLDVTDMALTPEQFYEAAGFPNLFLTGLLEHKDCPEDVIRKLATHPSSDTRAAVARCPLTPEDVLREQYEDCDDVRQSLALNRRLPVALQQKLAHVPEESVRTYLARNQNLHADLAEYLVHDTSEAVRSELAANPIIPIPVLLTLCDDQEPRVRDRALSALRERQEGRTPD